MLPFFVILSITGFVAGTNFTDCGSSARSIRSQVVGCDEEDNCPFIVGRNATFITNFTAAEDMNEANLKIFGVIGRVAIPFPVRPTKVCNSVYGLQCPLQADNSYNMRIELPVRAAYPRMRLRVQVELQSKQNKTDKILCTTFPIEIKSMDTTTPSSVPPPAQ